MIQIIRPISIWSWPVDGDAEINSRVVDVWQIRRLAIANDNARACYGTPRVRSRSVRPNIRPTIPSSLCPEAKLINPVNIGNLFIIIQHKAKLNSSGAKTRTHWSLHSTLKKKKKIKRRKEKKEKKMTSRPLNKKLRVLTNNNKNKLRSLFLLKKALTRWLV